MDKRIKKMWVEALRSGEYRQVKGALKQGEGYCCLGVLCVLYGNDTDQRGMDLPMMSYISPEVMEWARLEDSNPSVRSGRCQTTLAEMNDSIKTFKQIADVIEKQL